MSREDEIMRGDRGPAGWKIALFVFAIACVIGIAKLVAGTLGVVAVVAFCCGYLVAQVEADFRRRV